MRLRFLLLLAFTALVWTLKAQDYKVLSMESLPLDMTAREHIKQDERGRQCAVLRIATQHITPEQRTGFHFECDLASFAVERQIVDGEILVWVSPGMKTLKIRHATLGRWDLHTANYGITVEALHTYKIVLQGTSTSPDNPITKQFLVFDITPKDAMLTVNGTPWPVIDGIAQKMVDFGTYEYRIEVKDYHAISGKVDVFDPDNKVTVKKSLAPAFGYLKIEGDRDVLSKASVYIDNANGSDALQSPQRLGSGQHEVRILHPMYQAYQQSVTIKDNETYTLKVNLNANFANVTLKVDADAEIWVNGEKKGIRSWTGNLEAGSYIVECRMKDCKPTREERNITADMSGQTLTLPVPQPLTGMLVLNSTPAMAEIYIDGERKGETPMRINKLNVGKHSLRLVKEGYKPLNKSFNIEDGKTLQLEEKMEAEAPVVVKPEKPKKVEKEEPQPEKEKPAKPTTSSVWFATANAAYSFAPQASFGFSVGQVKRFGWFVSVMTNGSFKGISASRSCNAEGFLNDGSFPLYTGVITKDRHSVIAGGMVRLSNMMYARVGVGYGIRNLSWKDVNDQYYRNTGYSVSSIDLSAGLQMHIGKFAISLEGVTTNFKTIEGKLGLGIVF